MANFFNSMVNLTGIGSLLASPTNHDKKKMDTDSGSEYQQPSADSESSSSEEDYKQFMCSSTSASVATKSREKSRKKSLVDLTLTSPTPVSAVSNDLENPESLAQTFLETNRVAKKNRNKTWGKRGIDKPGRKKAVQNNSDEDNGKSNGKSNGKGDEKGDAKSADDDNCNSNTEEGKIGLSVSYTHTHTLHTHTHLGRIKFLQSRWIELENFKDAVHRMGLVIGQSDKKKQRYRLRVKGRHAKRITLTTFRYYSSEMAIVRTTGRNSVPLETVLAKWNELVPLNVAEEQPTEQECKRRPNVVWTQAAATKVLDMVDLTKTNCRLVSVCLFAFQPLYVFVHFMCCLLYTSPSPRDRTRSRMPSSA